MGERAYHGAQTCSGTNLRKCQDLGDSILLLLGSFILLNVGFNVVTLLWRHLKSSLRILFHHFFPKDTRKLCSGISSRLPHRPSLLLGRVSHLDSWLADTNDENRSRCCQMPPQCGHGSTPTEASWELWKEGLMGAGEAPQATVMKTQAASFSRPRTPPKIPKISKLDMAPSSLPQDKKIKARVDRPAHAPQQALTYSSTNTHEHLSTQSQAQTTEHTQLKAQGLEQTSACAPPAHPPDSASALGEALKPTNASYPTPSHNRSPTPPCPSVQDPTHSQAHALGQAQPQILAPTQLQVSAPTPGQSLAPSPQRTSAHTSPQPPTQALPYTSFQSQSHDDPGQMPGHTLTYSQAHVPEQTTPQVSGRVQCRSLLHPYANTPVPGPTSTPAPLGVPASASACAPPASALALPMAMTTSQGPATTSIPASPPAPSMLATFGPSFSTGRTVYDTGRVKQNTLLKQASQNPKCFRKDLNILSRPQEVKGLVRSGTNEQTPKQHGGDSAEPPAGSPVSYLESGNTAWKVSDNAKDKISQPKTLPYCSFHPCCSERKTEGPRAPVCPKFLVYAQDTAPSKPCFHSPSTAQSTQPTTPPPCTLSLPLVSPRTFAVPQPHCQKPSNLTQAPVFLSTSTSPQTVSSPHFPNPSQFSATSQTLILPPTPENQNFNRGLGLQRTPSPAKDSTVPRNPGLPQDPGLHKDLGLYQNTGLTLYPSLSKNSGSYKFPGCTQDPNPCVNPNISQESCLQKNLGITQDSELTSSSAVQDAGILRNHPTLSLIQPSNLPKNTIFIQTSSQKTLSFMQDSVVYRNVAFNQDNVIKNKNLSPATNQKRPDPTQGSGTGNIQRSGVCSNVSLSQSSRPQKSPCCTQDSEANKSSRLTQESSNHKSPGLEQTSCLHKCSGLTQDAVDYKILGPTQDSGIFRVPDFNQDSDSRNLMDAKKRLDLNQDVCICSSEYSKDPNLQECQAIGHDPVLSQSSGFKPPGLTQQAGSCKDSGLIPDSGLNKQTGFAPGTDSAQILGSLQTLMLSSSLVKPFPGQMASQKDSPEQHVPWTSVPANQNPCPSKAQVISSDLKTFSEVPVLVELQPPSQQIDGQDWVYHTADTFPSACQKHRQMSTPPKINWKPHCPGLGTRTGQVVFDSRQKQSVTGREKCETLSPRCPFPETPRSSEETQKEWAYQNVMRTLHKERANTHQE
ncbi:uncharacterized protein SPEM3 [Acomys russatus]|uniref:uncharacterized protein SPEM3 n=1 Tax=Acomys russatus TaxID=60746 RepID=UPI0021E30BC5|nr:uncharacterized protein SPEM3 [Acomys russatus]